MAICNPKNERIKRKYFEYQKEAHQKSQSTIDNIRKSITRYEKHTNYKDLKTFNKDKAIDFKKYLSLSKAKGKNEALSKSTLLSTTRNLKDFFKWLAYQPGYKSKINLLHIDYLNLSEKETRIAKAQKFKEYPTLEQIEKVILNMPVNTEIEKRDRALIAFTLLSGMRDRAIASLRLKHIDIERKLVKQDPREVKTKFSKAINTFFFPVGDPFEQIFKEWIDYLYKEKLYNNNDPVFPRTKLSLDKNQMFTAYELEPICWNSANQIRKIFKEAFEQAGLTYFTPHTFRNTLVNLGERICQTPEQFKAWSQNLGHEQVLTTFNSYGYITPDKQGEIIKNINSKKKEDNSMEELNKKFDLLLQKGAV